MFYEKKTEQYYTEMSSRWVRSKYFRWFALAVLVVFIAIAGNAVFCVHYVTNTRKMNVYNTALMYMHDRNPNAKIKQLIKLIEQPKIDSEWNKEIRSRVENYTKVEVLAL